MPSSSFFRAFDFANHFCEWMFDYAIPPPQYFSLSLNSWPSKEQQVSFYFILLFHIDREDFICVWK